MAVIITKLSDTEYTVNNKRAYQDLENNWIASPDMSTQEVAAFQKHLLKVNKLLANHS